MFRRDFIQRLTIAAGAGSLASAETIVAAEGTLITFSVKGFSCVTCAVGLEVMLRQQKGVKRAKASYPDGTIAVRFDPGLITEGSLLEFIKGQGFMADKKNE
jgi:copper chaperone CopZ